MSDIFDNDRFHGEFPSTPVTSPEDTCDVCGGVTDTQRDGHLACPPVGSDDHLDYEVRCASCATDAFLAVVRARDDSDQTPKQ